MTTLTGAIAYQFWTSSMFTRQITIDADLPIYCNVVTMPVWDETNNVWDFTTLTTIDTFNGPEGNRLTLVPDIKSSKIPADYDTTYLKIFPSGSLVDDGSVIGATIQVYSKGPEGATSERETTCSTQ